MKKSTRIMVVAMILIYSGLEVIAQVGINTDNSSPDPSAMLDVRSTDRGFLPPRVTNEQMYAITSPPEGLVVYNTTQKAICWFDGSSWVTAQKGGSQACDSVNYGGQTYHGILIGTQCWMRENLNIGNQVPLSQVASNNGIIEKYCYDDNAANCSTYGGLYRWDEMMAYQLDEGSQGICPAGWHVPADAEWTALTAFLGGDPVAGGKMKETGTTHWLPPNTGATNESMFTALPGGISLDVDYYFSLRYLAQFWSSTSFNSSSSYQRYLSNENTTVSRNNASKTIGMSVRCVKF
jgi:uncharacterized protein (TIGR02145 family)